MSSIKPNPPLVYLADNSDLVRTVVQDQLVAAGLAIYNPAAENNPENPTSFIGGFKCALLDLDTADGKDDAIDTAELLRVYQPTLPVGFLYEAASAKRVNLARAVAPVFKKPDDLAKIMAWVFEQLAS